MPRQRQYEAPSYEDWVRTTAQDLENKADTIDRLGIDVGAVMISVSSARWIATLLRNHADDMEINRG